MNDMTGLDNAQAVYTAYLGAKEREMAARSLLCRAVRQRQELHRAYLELVKKTRRATNETANQDAAI